MKAIGIGALAVMILAGGMAQAQEVSGNSTGAAAFRHSEFAPDGTWWQHQTEAGQTYFVAGEEDCYRNSVVKTPVWPNEYDDAIRSSVTAYYVNNPARINTAIPNVLRRSIHYHRTPTKNERYSDDYGLKHGEFVGDYWANMDLSKRQAFIQGYVSCKVRYLNFKPSRTLDGYERFVSSWFGVQGIYPTDADQVAAKTAGDTPIADVIDRAR